MIAQVFRLPAYAEGTETPQVAQDAAKRQRDVEGCEGIFIMRNRASQDMLAVTLWRDEAAMKAGAGYQQEEIGEAQKLNPSMQVPSPQIYEVVAHG